MDDERIGRDHVYRREEDEVVREELKGKGVTWVGEDSLQENNTHQQ